MNLKPLISPEFIAAGAGAAIAYALMDYGMHPLPAMSLAGIPSFSVVLWKTWKPKPTLKVVEVTSDASQHDECPNCGADASNFRGGPAGGMGVNILCTACVHEFNIVPLVWPDFLLIDELGPCGPGRAADVYGHFKYEPVPKGKFRFEVDGRPAAPIRDTLSEAHDDAVRNGYATYAEDGMWLDRSQGGDIIRG